MKRREAQNRVRVNTSGAPSPGDLPYPGIEPGSPVQQADSLPSEPPRKPFCSLDFSFLLF